MLGPMQATKDLAGAPIDLGRRRHRELVAILALRHHRPVSIDELAELLWEGSPPAAAGATIAGYVSLIRKALGDDALTTSRGAGYRLNLPAGLDLDTAERLDADAGRAASRSNQPEALRTWQRALELWRGPVLGDLAVCQWATPTAVRYEELRVRIAEQIIELRLGLGHHHHLVAELEQLVADHPLRERLWGQLMVALYRADRQGEALRAYGRVSAHLAELLGISPGAGLRDLEGSILRQSAELRWTNQEPALTHAHDTVRDTVRVDSREPDSHTNTFVGRHTALARLDNSWRRVMQGDGAMVGVAGPAGIGKTRLAAEMGKIAVGGGHRFLRGRCLPNAGIFQPFVDIVRTAWDRADHDERRHMIGEHAPEFSALLPDRTAELLITAGPDALTRAGYRTRLSELDADYARRAMAMALVGALTRIAEHRPVLFLIDDVHLADPATASLIDYCMQRPIPYALVVLTIRFDELAVSHDITRLIGDGAAQGQMEIIELDGFDQQEVSQMVQHHGIDLDEHQQATLLRRSGGNPFLCAQLLASPNDIEIPRGAVAFIRARIDRLVMSTDPLIADVLDTAALLGPSFPVDVLAGCIRVDTIVLFDALDQMARVGLVHDDPSQAGWFQFVPEIVRDVLLLGLAMSRQRIGHRRISEAWAHAPGVDAHTRASQVVHHELQAGPLADRHRLASTAIVAACAAFDLAAFDEALALSQAGLTAFGVEADWTDHAGPWPTCRFDLLLLCFRALDSLGRRNEAIAQAHTALALARHLGNAELTCRAIDACIYGSGVIEQASNLDLIAETASIMQPTMDADLRARLLTHQLYESTNAGNITESPSQLAAAALELVDRVEDLADRVELLQCVAETLDPSDRTQFDMIVDRCEQLASTRPTHLGLWRDVTHLRTSQSTRDGDVEAMRRSVDRHREIALSVQRGRMLAASAQKRALLAYFDGDLARSERYIDEMLTHDDNPDYQIGYLAHLLVLRRDQGRSAELVGVADALLDGAADRWVTCGATLVYAVNARPEQARHAIELVQPATMKQTLRHPGGLFLTACVAEAAALIGDTETAATLAPLLEPCALRHASMMAITSMGPVARVLGHVALSLGNDPEPWFRLALDTPGAPTHRARSVVDWADAYCAGQVGSGPSPELISAAEASSRQCGAEELLNRCLVHLRADQSPGPLTPSVNSE